jgi:hypothetical protein
MLWDVAPITLKEVKAPTILLPIGGGGRDFHARYICLSCQLELKFYFHTSKKCLCSNKKSLSLENMFPRYWG